MDLDGTDRLGGGPPDEVHVAVADAQGHCEFRAPNVAPGTAQVFVGNNPDDGGCCRSGRSDQRAAAVQGMTRLLPPVVPGLNDAKDD